MHTMQAIHWESTYLGIELGSTRIKALLLDSRLHSLAAGEFSWENQLIDGVWTYALDNVWEGLRSCYCSLCKDLLRQGYPLPPTFGAIGISGMMHGYLPLDAQGRQLAPFRTWRNTMTKDESELLSTRLEFHIPQRWSIAHLYQAIRAGLPHVRQIRYLTTLAGYVHWKLTGSFVLGIGDASGMFPVGDGDFDQKRCAAFDELVPDMPWKLHEILPSVLRAGENAGFLSEEGARLLDSTGTLRPGIAFCPPEGDAATGMVATNSILPRTGNVSVGTSIFTMAVLERPLHRFYPEVDIVATPDGAPVAMIHCNNGLGEIDAWAGLLRGFLKAFGLSCSQSSLYQMLYALALQGDADCGGLLAYNYLSGEHITELSSGRPLLVRAPGSRFTPENLMRTQVFSALSTLRIGMDVLTVEGIHIDRLFGHGGFFKSGTAGQRLMAAALNVPISVMDSAAEGGAWGIAVLAAFRAAGGAPESFGSYLTNTVFTEKSAHTVSPIRSDAEGYNRFLCRFRRGLAVERTAASLFEC